MNRLPFSPSQRIQRDKPLAFTWQGKSLSGLAGDSVATALFAAGVRLTGRSLKYHRPRGLYSLDGESANCLVNIDGECNLKAEQTQLRAGMQVRAQNYLGSLEHDFLALLDKFDRFMPAGFYYRRFHKPYALWPFFEKIIRRLAGTGVVSPDKEWNPQNFPELYPQAEVCVVGGGPAGMRAALAAAQCGLRVALFEARPWLGGFYDWRIRGQGESSLCERGQELARQVAAQANIRVFTQAFVIDLCGDNLLSAVQMGTEEDGFCQRYISLRSRAVVLATGCGERPLIFAHNERPGVMQPSCAWRLARTYGIMPGSRAVFSLADDLGLQAALDLAGLGLKVQAVADARTGGHDPELVAKLKEQNIPFLPGWAVAAAQGKKAVNGAVLGSLDGDGRQKYDCDLLAVSAGANPLTGLLCTAGAKLAYDKHSGFFLPRELPPGVFPTGRLLAYQDPEALEAHGELAGLQAAAAAGCQADIARAQAALDGLPGPAAGCSLVHGPALQKGRKAFICFDEDGTYKTARQSREQGFDQPELAKRFGGFGLGPGQSGIPGSNLPLVMAELSGDQEQKPVPTTVRSPLTPVLMAALAGPMHDIHKRTPLHQEQEALGAVFRRVGAWQRARYFSGDMDSSAEIAAVRNSVGLMDVSTLGKFRLYGPDALKALQRVYISNMSRMNQGRLKYSAMLNPDGMLMDDGVVNKQGEQDYYFTTSSGRASDTDEWFRYHTRHEDWDYHLVNLSDALGAINLAGPRSREVLAALTGFDLSKANFPFMGYREFKLKDLVPVKALRVGFVGELSYELHFPASYGPLVWQWLMEAGRAYAIRPFGLEAQFVCRLEKGHVIIGQESEQRVNLLDLGLGFLWDQEDTMSGKVGAPALRFTQGQPGRLKLAGFTLEAAAPKPDDGAVIYEGDRIQGFVCSCRTSGSLEKVIGLALVHESLAREGTQINIYQNEGNNPKYFQAHIAKPPFYDPQGLRLKA